MSTGEHEGFLSSTLSPGLLMLITAAMRVGKSNVASWLMEKAVSLGYHVYTNMLFFDYDTEVEEAVQQGILHQKKEFYRRKPPEIHTVTKASELFLGLYSTKKNISVLDEALLFAGSKKGVSKDIRWFEEMVTQIGKLDSSLVLIAQTKSKLATMLKEDLPSHEIKVYKLSFTNRYVEIWYNPPQSVDDPEDPYKLDSWDNIPPTRYPYDHKAPAGFEFDIDMEKFISRISKLNSLKTRKEVPLIIKDMLVAKSKNGNGNIPNTHLIAEMLHHNPEIKFNDARNALRKLFGRSLAERSFYHIKKELNIQN